jgi:hypothetical protein
MVPGASVPPEAATLSQSVSVAGQEVSVSRRAAELAAREERGGRGGRGVALAVAAVATFAVVVAVGLALGNERTAVRLAAAQVTQVATPYVVTVEAVPGDAQIEVDGETLGTGRASRSFARDGQRHRLRVSAPGYVAAEIGFDADQRPPERVALAAVPAVAAVGAAPVVAARPAVGAVRPRPAAVVARPRVAPVVAPVAEEVGSATTTTGLEIH